MHAVENYQTYALVIARREKGAGNIARPSSSSLMSTAPIRSALPLCLRATPRNLSRIPFRGRRCHETPRETGDDAWRAVASVQNLL